MVGAVGAMGRTRKDHKFPRRSVRTNLPCRARRWDRSWMDQSVRLFGLSRVDGRHGRHSRSEDTRLNSSHSQISYAVFCLKKKKPNHTHSTSFHTLTAIIH